VIRGVSEKGKRSFGDVEKNWGFEQSMEAAIRGMFFGGIELYNTVCVRCNL